MRGARLFVTGATGFFGKWLLESIAAANDRLGAGVRATLLSRDPGRFAGDMPRLAARPEFDWWQGDAADFSFPNRQFDYVFHLATASAVELATAGPEGVVQSLRGTERVLLFARTHGVRRLLFASSGAVYGRLPSGIRHVPENYPGRPDPADPASTYGETKRTAETLCIGSGLDCVIARGFAFVGPYLPLTDKFAVGSFIRDALAGGPVRVNGDGTPLRSYLYAGDLAIWLLTLLLRGRTAQAYNVGSNDAISLAGLARAVAGATGGIAIEFARHPSASAGHDYVPSIDKCRREVGLDCRVPLTPALQRTLDWARSGQPNSQLGMLG